MEHTSTYDEVLIPGKRRTLLCCMGSVGTVGMIDEFNVTSVQSHTCNQLCVADRSSTVLGYAWEMKRASVNQHIT